MSRVFRILVAASVVGCSFTASLPAAANAGSAGPRLVRDIATGTDSSEPMELTAWQGSLFFEAYLGSGYVESLMVRTPSGNVRQLAKSGYLGTAVAATPDALFLTIGGDLWRTDGTVNGTRELAGPHYVDSLVWTGTRLLFTGVKPCGQESGCDQGSYLYASNAAGTTVHLVGDGLPVYGPLAANGGRVFFGAWDQEHGNELWVSDGTAPGTHMLRDLWPGKQSSQPASLVRVGRLVYFTAVDRTHGRELWRTDGAAAGTWLVRDIRPGLKESGITTPVGVRGMAYFAADDGRHGVELWRSDGTRDGTSIVRDFPGSSRPARLTATGGRIWYSAILRGQGREPFVSDGTRDGTRMVRDVARGAASSAPSDFVALGGQVYFAATAGAGRELWRSDGTTSGTDLARDIYPGSPSSTPKWLARVGDELFFDAFDPAHGKELWQVRNGHVSLADDINTQARSPNIDGLAAVGNNLCFRASTGALPAGYRTVWHSDGTASGTASVGVVSDGTGFTRAANGQYYFINHRTKPVQSSLWSTDCATGAATLVGREAAGDHEYWIGPLPVGDRVYVPTVGLHYAYETFQGSAYLGRVQLGADPVPQEVGDRLYLFDLRGHGGGWYIDQGTDAVPVAPSKLSDFYLEAASQLGSTLIVQGRRGAIWATDGTDDGTQQLYSPTPNTSICGCGEGTWLVHTTARVFFTVTQSVNPAAYELWTTDGTTACTTVVATFPNVPGSFTVNGDLLYFTVHASNGTQLWRSDGTPAGTQLLGTFPLIGAIATVGGTTLFSAQTGTPQTTSPFYLWTTDGTPGGTRQISQRRFASIDIDVATLVSPNIIAFAADDGVHGSELWRTDGTDAGTELVADINPGPAGSAPGTTGATDCCDAGSPFVVVDNTLYFVAYTPTYGRELWKWTP